SITGTSGSVTVNPSGVTQFSVSPATSTPTSGTPFNVTVTALDAHKNPATTTYTGAKNLDLSGPASAPDGTAPSWTGTNVAATFSAGSVATISTTLVKAESTTLTAKDHTTTSITGTSGSVTVSPSGLTSLSFTTQPSGAVEAVDFTSQPQLVAKDAVGNGVPSSA